MRTIAFLVTLLSGFSTFSQAIQNSNYSTVGYIKEDGTVQNGNYTTIG